MDPDMGVQSRIAETEVAAIRTEAAQQLESARELAKRVRAEAMHELEDARARVARIAAREEEMAQRWAELLEAENALVVAKNEVEAKTEAIAPPSVPNDPPTMIAEIVGGLDDSFRVVRPDVMLRLVREALAPASG